MSRRSKSAKRRAKSAAPAKAKVASPTPLPTPEPPPRATAPWWVIVAICAALAGGVWLVFGQTIHHDFVNFDDDQYVYENIHINRGFSPESVARAFTHVHSNNWHPLTTLSHILDCQLFGLDAGKHHLVNVLLHAATAIALFLVLWRMTAALWCSAFVAAVFAIHPLRVESVAWVAERKDVLSGLFFVLTLGAYLYYARRRFSLARYLLLLVPFCLGLMSKPMLVTLPCVLLLLDFWPLRRLTSPAAGDSLRRVIVEKIPLFLLVVGSCMATLWAQTEAMQTLERIPLDARLVNSTTAFAVYIGQLFWPANLAVLYPFPSHGTPLWRFVTAVVVLLGVSLAAVLLRRSRPYLLMGWLWYLGTLVPVIGLLQVGTQAHADRYTYLTQIGLLIALTWLIADLSSRWSRRAFLLAPLAAAILIPLGLAAHAQTQHWKNSISLWEHTVAVTSGNYVAHNNFGNVLYVAGRRDEAVQQYQLALQIHPKYPFALNNLGGSLAERGQLDDAIALFRQAIELDPQYASAYYNLGNALLLKGKVDEAIASYRKSIESNPEYVDAYFNLGNTLFEQRDFDGALQAYQQAFTIDPRRVPIINNIANVYFQQSRFEDSIATFRQVLAYQPNDSSSHAMIGSAYYEMGRVGEAINALEAALALNPEDPLALRNLALALATAPDGLRDGPRAVQLGERALAIKGNRTAVTKRALALAYAESGDRTRALTVAREGLEEARAQNNPDLISAFEREITAIENGQPIRR